MHKPEIVAMLRAFAALSLVFGGLLPAVAQDIEKADYLMRVLPDDVLNDSLPVPEANTSPAQMPPGTPAAVSIKRVTRPVQIKILGRSRHNTKPGASSRRSAGPSAGSKDKPVPTSYGKAVMT